MPGSTSTWVRTWVVPWTIAFSSVRLARAYTSSDVNSRLIRETSAIASSSVPVSDRQRSRMQDLSRCRWVSTKPGRSGGL
jgi:hypothetical protein